MSITVKGKVQGVFYRQSTKEKARELGITGKVMNLDNGDVQIIATGTEERINQFIEWCRQGPPRANVTGLEAEEINLQEFNNFQIDRP